MHLIVNCFRKHAKSRSGRINIDICPKRLYYDKTRLSHVEGINIQTRQYEGSMTR